MAVPASDDECRAFLAAQGVTDAAPPDLAPGLGELLAAAAEASPEIQLDRVALAEFLGRLVPSDIDGIEALRARVVADLAVAHACLAGDPAAIRRLEDDYLKDLGGLLVKQGFDGAVADDTVQNLRLRLLTGERPILHAYSGIGALKAWLRVTALREAVRAQRKTHALDAEAISDALADDAADPALSYQRKLYQDEFRAAFAQAIDTLTVRERNLLRQCVVYGASIDDLGSLYKVHRATAARWIQLARQRLADETKRHMLVRLRIQPTEYDSILTLIHSQLHVSIERVLGAPDVARPQPRPR
jgi:RNA polymerase sigma-70 factor (ECF subfamily)